MEEKLIAALDKILAWAETTEAFVIEQAPLVVQELILYQRTWLLVYLLICWALAGCLIAWSRWLWKTIDRADDRADRVFGSGALGIFGGLVFFVSTLIITEPLLKVWLAPRLFVLEYLRELI